MISRCNVVVTQTTVINEHSYACNKLKVKGRKWFVGNAVHYMLPSKGILLPGNQLILYVYIFYIGKLYTNTDGESIEFRFLKASYIQQRFLRMRKREMRIKIMKKCR